MEIMVALLPEWLKKPLRPVRAGLARHYGWGRHCTVCGSTVFRFEPFGINPRPDARCGSCGALERHRLVWLFFQQRTDLFNGRQKRVLHVAPERALENKLQKRLGPGYLSADLFEPRAMEEMDITDIQYPDETFDVIYCSHVLEHVTDDRKAMTELHRVLKRDGWAVLLVPITADETFEDPSIVDPAERLEAFGQEDHVRRYGPDYIDRLHEAGFMVETTTAADFMDEQAVRGLGLTAGGKIFYCTR
jgi:SAM-dependent methyltransferase